MSDRSASVSARMGSLSARMRPWWSRMRPLAWRWSAVALSVSLVAVVADLLDGPAGAYTVTPQVGVAFNAYQLVGVGMAVWASRHRNLERRSRRAWGVIAVAFVLLAAAGVLREVFPTGLAFPTPADVLRLLFVPVFLIGLLVLPLRAQDRRERHKVWLDTMIVVVAGGMVLWYLEIGPSVELAGRIPVGALVASLAYPILDLMLIFGAAVVLFRGAAPSARGPAVLLGLAMIVIVIGDVYLGYRQSHEGTGLPDRWQFACWLTGHFLLAMAAFAQCRLASRDRAHSAESGAGATSALPYVAVTLSYLLLIVAVRGQSLRLTGLVAGAVIITGVVVARQVIALRQNHELAITDALTGLVNRRQLHDRLRLALVRGGRNGRGVATMLIDMNGFKQINDTMGHEAGDQLLVAFGQVLRRNVLGLDVVGRLGGDEFAIVLHDIDVADSAMAVARRILADMQSPVMIGDTAVQPRAAIGVSLSGPGECTADQLLHRADEAMYLAKAAEVGSCALYREPVGGEVVLAL